MFQQKVIQTQLLPLTKHIYSCQDPPVFLGLPRLDLHDLPINHPHHNLLHLLPELLCLPLADFGSVDPPESEDELGWRVVEPDSCADGVAVGDLYDLCYECFVVEGELLCVFDVLELLILAVGEGLHFGESDSFRQKDLYGAFDHFLFVEPDSPTPFPGLLPGPALRG